MRWSASGVGRSCVRAWGEAQVARSWPWPVGSFVRVKASGRRGVVAKHTNAQLVVVEFEERAAMNWAEGPAGRQLEVTGACERVHAHGVSCFVLPVSVWPPRAGAQGKVEPGMVGGGWSVFWTEEGCAPVQVPGAPQYVSGEAAVKLAAQLQMAHQRPETFAVLRSVFGEETRRNRERVRRLVAELEEEKSDLAVEFAALERERSEFEAERLAFGKWLKRASGVTPAGAGKLGARSGVEE